MRKMRRSISLATSILYAGRMDFRDLVRRISDDSRKSQLHAFIAIRCATMLDKPLSKIDVFKALSEFSLSLEYSDKKAFDSIYETYMRLAEMLWLRMTLVVLKGKAAQQVNKYSYDGTIYALQLESKGPISESEREKWKTITHELAEASKDQEAAELEVLKATDHAAYEKHMKEIEICHSENTREAEQMRREDMDILESIYLREEMLKRIFAGNQEDGDEENDEENDEDEDEDGIQNSLFRLHALESVKPGKPLTQEIVSLVILSHQRLGINNYEDLMEAALIDLKKVHPKLTREQLGDIFIGDE